MDPGPLRDVLTVVLGVATGALSGMFGVGGAVLSTPGIRLLGASALVAVGTTLPSIIPSAAAGTARYAREGLIDWRAVRFTAPIGMATAVVGSLLVREVPGEGGLLMLATAALLGLSAYRMVRAPDADDLTAETHGAPRPLRFALVGSLAGLLSGLLGIGGGIVMVPGFVQVAGMGVKRSIATSLVCVGIFAVPGTVTHALLDNIDWRFAVLLAAGVVPGARLGAALTVRAADRRLRLTVGAFLGLTALAYAAGEVAALVN